MNTRLKPILAAALAGCAAPALAQGGAPVAEAGDGIDDIVVTATRRSESAQNISTNVAAFTADGLAAANITNSVDLQQHVPGLIFSTNGSFGQPYIRGIGSDIINPGADSPVATYIDGAYQTRQTASVVDFFDDERVEVLKGPQGALYGRNATGGALNIITAKPADTAGFAGTASYGNYDRVQLRGMANLPLADGVAARVAGIYTRRDGYAYNPYLDTRLDGEKSYGVRASLRAKASERVTVILSGEYIHEDDTRNNANRLIVAPGLPAPVLNFAPVFGYPAPAIPADPRIINNDFPGRIYLRQKRLNLTVDWDLDFASLRSVTGYTDLRNFGAFDLDGSEVGYAYDREDDTSRAWTESLQLASNAGGRFRWIVGADYLHEHATQNFDARLFSFLFPPGTPLLGDASPVTGIIWRSRLGTDAWSAYADVQYDVSDRLRLLASARYSSERKRAVFGRTYVDPFGIVLGGAAQAPAGTVFPGLGTVTDPVAGTIGFDLSPRARFHRVTPKIAVEFRPRPGLLFYASATNGFKSGGFNLQNNGETFRPEKIWSYEAGLKSTLLDNRLRANLSGFYYDYTDLQVIRFDGLANNVNNADARIYGLEMELEAKPARNLTIGVNVAYLNARYTRYLTINSNFPAQGIVDLAGNVLPKSPKFSQTASIDYLLPLRGTGEVNLHGEVRMVSDTNFDQFETRALIQDGYALFNGRITFRPADRKWSVSAFGRNLTDVTYKQSFVRVDQFFGTVANYAAPRTYGVEIGLDF